MREIVGTHLCRQSTIVHSLASDCPNLLRIADTHPITVSASKTNISWSILDMDLFLRCGFSWSANHLPLNGRRGLEVETRMRHLNIIFIDSLPLNLLIINHYSQLSNVPGILQVRHHLFYLLYRINLQYSAGVKEIPSSYYSELRASRENLGWLTYNPHLYSHFQRQLLPIFYPLGSFVEQTGLLYSFAHSLRWGFS